MGKRVGDLVGEHVWTDADYYGDFSGSYLRIQVRLKLSAPLVRWVNIRVGHNETQKFEVVYERLPFFCFYYGLFTHLGPCCPEKKSDSELQTRYGRWRTTIRNVFNFRVDG